MKRCIILFALSVLCLLAACDTNNASSGDSLIRNETGIDPDSFVYLDTDVWPKNKYTNGLPVPSGTIKTAYIDIKNEFCFVMLNDVNDADFDKFLTELKHSEFSQIENIEEKIEGEDYISTGTMYSNGTTIVSISFADATLGIYIVTDPTK